MAFRAAINRSPEPDAKTPLTDAALVRLKDRHEAFLQAKKEADAAKEISKTQFIGEWIAANAPADIQEQYRDGLLARKDALQMIAASTFTEAGVPDEFRYNDEFCEKSSCPCGEHDIDALPRAQYQSWKELKAKLPTAATFDFHYVREHLADDGDGYDGQSKDTAGPKQYFVSLHLPVGPFTFDRNVHLEKRA